MSVSHEVGLRLRTSEAPLDLNASDPVEGKNERATTRNEKKTSQLKNKKTTIARTVTPTPRLEPESSEEGAERLSDALALDAEGDAAELL